MLGVSTTSSRLLALLSLLQTRRDWPGGVLADRMEVSPRTIRRDVDRLRELGYPIASAKGPDGGYRLEAGADLPPLLFDDEQAVALAVALRMATTAGAGIEEDALRALGTVRQVMPSRLRRRIDAIDVMAVRAGGAATPTVDGAVLAAVGDAAYAHEVLRFRYETPSGDGPAARDPGDRGDAAPAVRRVEPHHVVTWAGRWYLVAWDLDRDGWRTFRLDRITPSTSTGPRFRPREVPGGDVATFVVGRFRGSTDGTAAWPCRGTVVLERSAEEARAYAVEAIVEAIAPERCRVTLGDWSWTALAATVGRFDADVEVEGPPELVDAFRTLAHRCARAAGDVDAKG